jgi:IS1 family transposase
VRRCAACLRPLLILTDGWSAYPNSILRALREKVKLTKRVGRACLQVWPELHIGTVIKRTEKKRVVEITRKITHGLLEQAENLLHSSRGGMVLNTAFIERLNGTFRERLASLTRKSRHVRCATQRQSLRRGEKSLLLGAGKKKKGKLSLSDMGHSTFPSESH